eukprot:801964-Pleurochrysis_carterae.AAC.1
MQLSPKQGIDDSPEICEYPSKITTSDDDKDASQRTSGAILQMGSCGINAQKRVANRTPFHWNKQSLIKSQTGTISREGRYAFCHYDASRAAIRHSCASSMSLIAAELPISPLGFFSLFVTTTVPVIAQK